MMSDSCLKCRIRPDLHCRKTTRIMDIEKSFELFAALMEDEKVYMDPSLSFSSVCGWIGVPAEAMDAYLNENFGWCGSEVMSMYRRTVPLRFYEKYGILL